AICLLEPIENRILVLGEFHLSISQKRDSFRKHREGQFSKKRFPSSEQPISELGLESCLRQKEILSGSNGKRNSQKTFPGPEIRADLRTREINLFQEEILSGSDRECNAFSKKNNFPVQSRQSLNQGNCNDCQSIRQ